MTIAAASETQNITTNTLGLFSLFIGKGTPVTGTFAKVDWADAPKFLQVEMDVTGGTTYTDIGTQQMMSVPYAIYAENAGNGFAKMSQSQIDALTPEEGTLVFNTDTHTMQVYAMLTDNVVISNEAYEGTSVSSSGRIAQTFIPPVSGHIVGIDVLVKGDPSYPFSTYGITFYAYSPGESTSQHIQVHTPALLEYTWIKGLFDSPLPIVAGSEARFSVGPSKDLIFATNNKYPDGSITSPSEARGFDLVFRIHIQPSPDSYG